MCFTVRKISKLFFILCSAFVRLCELLKGEDKFDAIQIRGGSDDAPNVYFKQCGWFLSSTTTFCTLLAELWSLTAEQSITSLHLQNYNYFR